MSGPKKPKPWWLGAIFVVIGIAILLGLGVWQLQRLKWKEGLLAHIAALQGASAAPIPTVMGRTPGELDFVRVSVECPGLERAPFLRLYSLEQGETVDRIIAACPLPDGRSLLVDRGFAPAGAALPTGVPRLDAPVVGVLRIPSRANRFTPANDPAHGKWYSRDEPAMARVLGVAPPLSVMLMLEGPAPAGAAYPRPAAVPAEIPNRHLEYALTWFALAATLACVYIAMLLRRRSS